MHNLPTLLGTFRSCAACLASFTSTSPRKSCNVLFVVVRLPGHLTCPVLSDPIRSHLARSHREVLLLRHQRAHRQHQQEDEIPRLWLSIKRDGRHSQPTPDCTPQTHEPGEPGEPGEPEVRSTAQSLPAAQHGTAILQYLRLRYQPRSSHRDLPTGTQSALRCCWISFASRLAKIHHLAHPYSCAQPKRLAASRFACMLFQLPLVPRSSILLERQDTAVPEHSPPLRNLFSGDRPLRVFDHVATRIPVH